MHNNVSLVCTCLYTKLSYVEKPQKYYLHYIFLCFLTQGVIHENICVISELSSSVLVFST